MLTKERRLLEAASSGSLSELKSILEEKVDIETCDRDNRTALHLSCCYGQDAIVRFLIEQRVKLDGADRWGNQPLKYALLNGHENCRLSLINAGVVLSKECERDLEFKLCRLSAAGDLAGFQNLIQNGININSIDYDRRSSLHLAAANGHKHIVEYAISKGANAGMPDRLGRSPADDALHSGHYDIQKILIEAVERSEASTPSTCEPTRALKRGPLDVDASEGLSTEKLNKLAKYLTRKGATLDQGISWNDNAKASPSPAVAPLTPIAHFDAAPQPASSDLTPIEERTPWISPLLQAAAAPGRAPLPAAALHSGPAHAHAEDASLELGDGTSFWGAPRPSEAARPFGAVQLSRAATSPHGALMSRLHAQSLSEAPGAWPEPDRRHPAAMPDAEAANSPMAPPEPARAQGRHVPLACVDSMAPPEPTRAPGRHASLANLELAGGAGWTPSQAALGSWVEDGRLLGSWCCLRSHDGSRPPGSWGGSEAALLESWSPADGLRSHRLRAAAGGGRTLVTRTAARAAVVFVDIKGFTEACAALSAGEVGAWVADFYTRVDAAAAAHGVRKVEARGDCCICVADDDAEAGGGGGGGGQPGQVVAALAFATALNADLAALAPQPAGSRRASTSARMGIAAGPVAFLLGDPAAAPAPGGYGDAGGGFSSIQGDTVNVAARMESLSRPGWVVVHKSAVDLWAAETGRPTPRTACCQARHPAGPGPGTRARARAHARACSLLWDGRTITPTDRATLARALARTDGWTDGRADAAHARTDTGSVMTGLSE
jgi:ankyrin repeat protein/class 3 adenylate cyclase